MTYILITGGAGFIPSCLADKLLQNPNYHVVAVDNFLTGHSLKISNSIHNNYTFIEGDVNNRLFLEQLFSDYQFNYIFHYAAVVGVKRTTENPLLVLEDIDGIKNILELAVKHKVKRIFYSSSSEVYGEPVEMPQRELTTPLNSRLPYAIVKNLGEAFCRSYHQVHGLEYTIFRFFNTYGPKQSPDFVMSKFIRSALKNEPVTIFGDGSQTRTFCFFEDNIEACVNAFEQGKFVNDVINIGNDRETSVLELAQMIIEKTGSSSEIIHLPPLKEGDMTRRQPDITNMKTLLNRDLTLLEDGINTVIQSEIFYKLNGIEAKVAHH